MPFAAPGSPKSHPWLVSSFAHHLHSKFHYQPQFLGEMLPPSTIRPLHSMNAVIIAVIFAVHPSPQEGERYSYSLLLPNEWEFFLNPGRHLLREVLQLRYPKLPDHSSNLHSQNARNAKTIMPKSKEKKGSSSSSHLQRECGQSCHCFLDRDSHHRELAIPFASSTFTYYSHKTQTPKSGAQNHISPHHFLPSFLSSSEFVAMSRYEMKCNVVQLRYPPRILVENPSAATKPPNSPTTKQRATPCATEPKSPSVLACLLSCFSTDLRETALVVMLVLVGSWGLEKSAADQTEDVAQEQIMAWIPKARGRPSPFMAACSAAILGGPRRIPRIYYCIVFCISSIVS